MIKHRTSNLFHPQPRG